MHQTHIYDLGFVSPKRRPRTAPEIIFSINEQHLDEAINRLHKTSAHFFKYANDYLGVDTVAFSLPVPDLFGNKEFGYRNCGYWTAEEGKIHFRLPLQPHPWTGYCSLTIFVLTNALGFPFEESVGANRQQDVTLMTSCVRNRPAGYGHAAGGWLSTAVHQWLKDYAKNKVQSLGIVNGAPMHPTVTKAMRDAWLAVSPPDTRKYYKERDIYGWVRESGAFTLSCFGDACDLSVYPDTWLGEGCESIELGCHNLDQSTQQLTLISGLATICQLVRESS